MKSTLVPMNLFNCHPQHTYNCLSVNSNYYSLRKLQKILTLQPDLRKKKKKFHGTVSVDVLYKYGHVSIVAFLLVRRAWSFFIRFQSTIFVKESLYNLDNKPFYFAML